MSSAAFSISIFIDLCKVASLSQDSSSYTARFFFCNGVITGTLALVAFFLGDDLGAILFEVMRMAAVYDLFSFLGIFGVYSLTGL